MVYAKDYKCDDCGKQADVWFPIFDPDIPSYPYCKKCAEKRRMDLLIRLSKIDRE